jgi:hypothetical protein
MVPRYLIILAPIYFIGIALAYKPAYGMLKNRGVVYALMALLVLLSVTTPFFSGYYSSYTKEDWRGFSGQISRVAQPGDTLVFVPGYISQPFDYYYTNASYGTFEYGASTAEETASISPTKANSKVFYIVTGDISSADPSGGTIAWLQQYAKGIEATPGIYVFTVSNTTVA